MTVHLSAEGFTAPGMDTFWDWARRSFPNAKARRGEFAPVDIIPCPVTETDLVLHYAALGAPQERPERTVALLWELYPEMARYLPADPHVERKVRMMRDCAVACKWRTVSSAFAIPDFEEAGAIEVLPIGVDTDLMRPRPKEKEELREKWKIPQRARVGFWSGTLHPMKGFQGLVEYARDNPDVFWVILWKWPPSPPEYRSGISGNWEKRPATPLERYVEYWRLPQTDVAELMAACDFVLCPGLLRPFYLVEWEAMASGLEPVIVGNPVKDFIPSGDPRADVFTHCWDRHQALVLWRQYLAERGVE